MKKTWLLLAAILLVYAVFFLPEKKQEAEPAVQPANGIPVFKTTGDCASQVDSGIQIYCYNAVAMRSLDYTLCEKNADSLAKDWCYYTIAVKVKSKKLCEKILDEKLKQGCEWEAG